MSPIKSYTIWLANKGSAGAISVNQQVKIIKARPIYDG